MILALKSLFILILIMCSSSSSAGEVHIVLEWVKPANTAVDAKKNVMNGDYRFKAVYRYTLMLPGLAEAEKYEAKTKGYFVVIEGSYDTPCHFKLVNLAIEYAKNYKLRILNPRKANMS